MDYEDLIEDDEEPVAEPAEPELEPEEDAPRARSPWKAFILTGLLAGLIGAAGGSYGAYLGLKQFSPKTVEPVKVDLSPIEARLNQLNDRLTSAETKARDALEQEIKPVDLTPLKARLESLETAPLPDIDPEALAALQAAQDDGFKWPDISELEARLAVLEEKFDTASDPGVPVDVMNRIAAIETEMETVRTAEPIAGLDEDIMSDFSARIAELENRPAPNPVVKRVSILAFPKAQLTDAVEDNRTGGMIEKTLSRHIRVKDANDPMTLIDGIETDLSEGRLAAAAEKFERLPSPVRSAGQAWYDSVKAAL